MNILTLTLNLGRFDTHMFKGMVLQPEHESEQPNKLRVLQHSQLRQLPTSSKQEKPASEAGQQENRGSWPSHLRVPQLHRQQRGSARFAGFPFQSDFGEQLRIRGKRVVRRWEESSNLQRSVENKKFFLRGPVWRRSRSWTWKRCGVQQHASIQTWATQFKCC